jgi:GGDEF domain-containing protein
MRIARRLERHRADRAAMGVLTVEIDDLERLLASASGMEVAGALEAVERSLREVLGEVDELCRSRLGHHWVITDDANPSRLRELGERLAAAVSQAGELGGTPLTASVGIASFPEDGEDVDELVAKADEMLFVARAAGVRLA